MAMSDITIKISVRIVSERIKKGERQLDKTVSRQYKEKFYRPSSSSWMAVNDDEALKFPNDMMLFCSVWF